MAGKKNLGKNKRKNDICMNEKKKDKLSLFIYNEILLLEDPKDSARYL